MNAVLRRFLMHYGVYRRYPLGRLPALRHRPTSLTKRLASVEEVANMVVYVCSPQASATTGAALRVDGGVVRSIA